MLFLLNDYTLDVGDPYATFLALHNGKFERASLARAVRAGQKHFYKQVAATGGAAALLPIAAEIASSCAANAALFVTPAFARGPQDVAIQLAETSLTTLALLLQQQELYGPSIARANTMVWRFAVRPAA
jgi:hypothetical protein